MSLQSRKNMVPMCQGPRTGGGEAIKCRAPGRYERIKDRSLRIHSRKDTSYPVVRVVGKRVKGMRGKSSLKPPVD